MTLLEDANVRSMNETLDKEHIESILKTHFQRMRFTIDENGEVTVIGDCIATADNPWKNDVTSIPVKFKHVSKSFVISSHRLRSLEGSPRTVYQSFRVYRSHLMSLEGSPDLVGGDFDCTFNELTSLKGLSAKINGHLLCQNNRLTSLDSLPDSFTGGITLTHYPDMGLLRLLRCDSILFNNIDGHDIQNILNKYCGGKLSRSKILSCQKELIDNGFEGNASW